MHNALKGSQLPTSNSAIKNLLQKTAVLIKYAITMYQAHINI